MCYSKIVLKLSMDHVSPVYRIEILKLAINMFMYVLNVHSNTHVIGLYLS